MKTIKQTAGNNATLKAVRKLMNDAIYRTFAAIYNASGEGDALRYLSQYFNVEGWTRVLKDIPQTQARDRTGDPRPDDDEPAIETCPACHQNAELVPSTGMCDSCTDAAYDAACPCTGEIEHYAAQRAAIGDDPDELLEAEDAYRDAMEAADDAMGDRRP